MDLSIIQSDELCSGLGIVGLNQATGFEPVSDSVVGPSRISRITRAIVIAGHEVEKLITGASSLGLDDAVLDEPVTLRLKMNEPQLTSAEERGKYAVLTITLSLQVSYTFVAASL